MTLGQLLAGDNTGRPASGDLRLAAVTEGEWLQPGGLAQDVQCLNRIVGQYVVVDALAHPHEPNFFPSGEVRCLARRAMECFDVSE